MVLPKTKKALVWGEVTFRAFLFICSGSVSLARVILPLFLGDFELSCCSKSLCDKNPQRFQLVSNRW